MATTLSDPATTAVPGPPPAGATLLPGGQLVGTTATWHLHGTDGELLTLRADFIGWASSRSRTHWDHSATAYAPVNVRCRACRWFEPRIFREVRDIDDPEPERYLVHSAGVTVVPGERILTKHAWALSADEVLDLLATSRDRDQRPAKCPVCDGSGKTNRPPYIAGDQSTWTSSTTGPYPCHACGGQGIVFGPAREAHYSVPAKRVLIQAAGLDEELAEAKTRRGL